NTSRRDRIEKTGTSTPDLTTIFRRQKNNAKKTSSLILIKCIINRTTRKLTIKIDLIDLNNRSN
ncbi:MAG: hypothetical protein MHPSP_004262, partial [Paramarteilia canceri]